MGGPPYPRPRSNAIGDFVIGVSPIGPLPFDYWSTVISQYANSDILTTLIGNFSECLDDAVDWQAFFDLIWNVDTAQGYGLDVWGRIVGVSRVVHIPGGTTYFGFEEQANTTEPFNQAPFYSGSSATENFTLTDTAYRTLIFAKALTNISDGSIKSINQVLLALFPGRGNAYATDGLNMTMTYTFKFTLSTVETAIVQQSGALPKPAGVQSSIVINPAPPGSGPSLDFSDPDNSMYAPLM